MVAQDGVLQTREYKQSPKEKDRPQLSVLWLKG